MSKHPVVNRKTVLAAIRKGGVTGVGISRCAVSVAAELGIHPSMAGKIEEILAKLIDQGIVRVRDARVQCVSDLVARPQRKEFDRAAARRSGGLRACLCDVEEMLDEHPAVPVEWRGCDPDEYNTGAVAPEGGWSERGAEGISYELMNKLRRQQIAQLYREQFIDWSTDQSAHELTV